MQPARTLNRACANRCRLGYLGLTHEGSPMADMNTPIHITRDTLAEAVVWLVSAAFFGGLAVPLGWQVFGYLRSGEWVPFSALDAMSLFSDSPWLRSPGDWLGVHRMLDAIHGGLFLMAVFGLVGLIVVGGLTTLLERGRQSQVNG